MKRNILIFSLIFGLFFSVLSPVALANCQWFVENALNVALFGKCGGDKDWAEVSASNCDPNLKRSFNGYEAKCCCGPVGEATGCCLCSMIDYSPMQNRFYGVFTTASKCAVATGALLGKSGAVPCEFRQGKIEGSKAYSEAEKGSACIADKNHCLWFITDSCSAVGSTDAIDQSWCRASEKPNDAKAKCCCGKSVVQNTGNGNEQGCCATRETSSTDKNLLIEKAEMTTRAVCESRKKVPFYGQAGNTVDAKFSPNMIVDADGKKCVTPPNKGSGNGGNNNTGGGGSNPGITSVEVKLDYTGMTNPLNTIDIPTVVGKVVKAILSILGSIFLIMIIYGGFTWMTAMGNDAKVKKGRNILVWAIVGITVIFLAWVLVALVFESINV